MHPYFDSVRSQYLEPDPVGCLASPLRVPSAAGEQRNTMHRHRLGRIPPLSSLCLQILPAAFEFSFEYLDLPVEELRRLIVEEVASFRAEREAMRRRRKDALAAKGRAKVMQ